MTGALPIRAATPSDASGIAAVHLRSWVATYDLDPSFSPSVAARTSTWRARIRGRAAHEHLLVAVQGQRIAGFVWAGPTTDPGDDPQRVAQIRSLHVDPPAQGVGVGSALLRAAAERMACSGHRQLSLWVVAENAPARTFYERQGWETDGARRREQLAMPGEDGPTVTVVRYRTRSGTG